MYIRELFEGRSARLTSLKARAQARSRVLPHVLAALPATLAAAVPSAGLEHGQLTIGVAGGAFASRLRYMTEILRRRVGDSLGVEIQRVRIKVVQPMPLRATSGVAAN